VPHNLVTSTVNSVAAKTLLFGDDMLLSYAAQITKMEAIRLQTSFASAIRGLLLHDAVVFDECGKRGCPSSRLPDKQARPSRRP
jgi:hypothetical protein